MSTLITVQTLTYDGNFSIHEWHHNALELEVAQLQNHGPQSKMKMWKLFFRNYQGAQDCTGRALNQVCASSKHDYTGYRPTKPTLCIRKKTFSVFFSFGI